MAISRRPVKYLIVDRKGSVPLTNAFITTYAIGGGAMLAMLFMIIVLMRKGQGRFRGNIAALAMLSLNWHIVGLFYYLIEDAARAIYLKDMTLPYMTFFLSCLLLYVLRFTGLDRYHTPASVLLFCLIPVLTYAAAATGGFHELLRTSTPVSPLPPEYWNNALPGAWFYVNAAYCLGVTALAIILAVARYRLIPRGSRAAGAWLVAGCVIAGAGAVLSLSGILTELPDTGLLGAAISTVFCYIAGKSAGKMDSLSGIRRDIFDEIDKCVFMLDSENRVVTLNRTASARLESLGISLEKRPLYADVVGRVFEAGESREIGEQEADGMDYAVKGDGKGRLYNLREKDIADRRGKKLGAVAVWEDVTEDHAVIRKLEETAGLDALTGLLNRGKLEQELLALDTLENLPIAVIVGNLNNLKMVNDTRGHAQGDIVLRATAEALRFCCPPRSLIARTGGDEFVVVIPGWNRSQAQALICGIDGYLASPRDPRARISIALGASAKLSGYQDMRGVIGEADARMYADKHQKKFSAVLERNPIK